MITRLQSLSHLVQDNWNSNSGKFQFNRFHANGYWTDWDMKVRVGWEGERINAKSIHSDCFQVKIHWNLGPLQVKTVLLQFRSSSIATIKDKKRRTIQLNEQHEVLIGFRVQNAICAKKNKQTNKQANKQKRSRSVVAMNRFSHGVISSAFLL